MAANDLRDDNMSNNSAADNLDQASKIHRKSKNPGIDYLSAKQKSVEASSIGTVNVVAIERDGQPQNTTAPKRKVWNKFKAEDGTDTNDGLLEPVSEHEWSMKPKSAILNLYSEVRNASEPVNYYTDMCIGRNNPRSFKFEVDTGSSLIWVQSKISETDTVPEGQEVYDCISEDNEFGGLFNGRLDLNKRNMIQEYGSAKIQYDLQMDCFHIGIIKAEGQTLGAAPIRKLPPYFRNRSFHGIIGLGPQKATADTGGIQTNLLLNLKAQGQIDRAVLTMIGPNVRSVLKPQEEPDSKLTKGLSRGFLAIGSPYAEYVDGQVVWCEVVQDLNSDAWSKEKWVVKLDKLNINGTVVCTDQLALIDTGTAFVLAADSNMKKVVQHLQGRVSSRGDHFVYDEKSLRNISFEFAGGVLEFEPANFFTGGESTARIGCVTKAPPSKMPSNVWVLGGAFLDCMVSIFDYEQNRIGALS
ncbi:putative Cathepsin E-B [Glarea lozoyensis 74030]|uniref:Putative Cathepsin E-B n=1 Tax=Glarea lozoyensis (strain ATCC 74030 / MF5533) TaxID=1104152 RepID=H0EY75_GLAL7|nr:putative Cathepsin E-B [Glarea lozoyensis 74030]